jgi:hypothetical protein
VTKTRIAVIGRGTAGCMSAAHFARHTDAEIDWYFDPNIKPQAVGEGSNLSLPSRLNQCINFSPRDFDGIGATIKTGIYKENWGKLGKPYLHDFPSPHTALHFDAPKLQDFMHKKLEDHVNIKAENVKAEDLDADYVLDCSGRPEDYSDFEMSPYIPVNAVHVTQCDWDFPRFNYTLAIARPYGWVFGIPLKHRCSIGYMYNENINTLEEVKEDVKVILEQYGLSPNGSYNTFSFKNYRRKFNYNGHIAYNGNSSFFLEPLEATSFGCVDYINVTTLNHWFGKHPKELSERRYQANISANENIIMMHYAAGSNFNTDFWEFATERGVKCLENADPSMKFMMENSKQPVGLGSYYETLPTMGKTIELEALSLAWWQGSFDQNMEGLGLRT